MVRAVQEAAVNGLSFGAPTEAEIELAEVLISRLPSLEQVRLVSSGTEATMSAIRLARGATGRNTIVKFEGCYHGHADSLLVKAGSGLLTFGNPSSAGVPPEFVSHTLTLEYNNLEAVREAFAQHGADIACIIVEPVAGNMNLIKPAPGFLEGLREVCTQHGALLIFDEVMTGFRVGPQGVQGLTGVKPDITTLAKVIGGGMPVGAYGGRRELMQQIAPAGPIYQAGTLSGNPVAMAAGLATLRLIAAPGFYDKLSAQTAKLAQGLQARARRRPGVFRGFGGRHVRHLFQRQGAGVVRRGLGLRHGGIQPLLPRHAGSRRALRAVRLRSRFRLGHPRRRRDPVHAGHRGQGLQIDVMARPGGGGGRPAAAPQGAL